MHFKGWKGYALDHVNSSRTTWLFRSEAVILIISSADEDQKLRIVRCQASEYRIARQSEEIYGEPNPNFSGRNLDAIHWRQHWPSYIG